MKRDELNQAKSILNGRHSQVVKAWLDGAIIQWRMPGDSIWFTPENQDNYAFIHENDYRVKPQPREMKVALYKNKNAEGIMIRDESSIDFPDDYHFLERISDVYTIKENLS
jgi:hypothetical protein